MTTADLAVTLPVASASTLERSRVLCVDDDPAIGAVLSRILRSEYDVTTVDSATAALEQVRAGPPFSVVISDYRMPKTDGVSLLGWICEIAPDTVRVLLTGNGDMEIAVDAVNRGRIFRFLAKPCAPDVLRSAVSAARDQYQLITSERVLLEQTLHGSVRALTDVLALAQPEAFGRATRIRRHVGELADRLEIRDRWPIEIAAMLSQVGCAALPSASINRFYAGEQLSSEERALVANMPAVAERLIAGIPRLDGVREILRFQDTRYDGFAGDPPVQRGVVRDALPFGARVLKLVLDFDSLEMRGLSPSDAMHTLRGRTGWYDPAVLAAFSDGQQSPNALVAMQEMRLSHVQAGMVFAADVRGESGMLLVARGQEVNVSLVERIQHQWSDFASRYMVSMLVHAEAA